MPKHDLMAAQKQRDSPELRDGTGDLSSAVKGGRVSDVRMQLKMVSEEIENSNHLIEQATNSLNHQPYNNLPSIDSKPSPANGGRGLADRLYAQGVANADSTDAAGAEGDFDQYKSDFLNTRQSKNQQMVNSPKVDDGMVKARDESL